MKNPVAKNNKHRSVVIPNKKKDEKPEIELWPGTPSPVSKSRRSKSR